MDTSNPKTSRNLTIDVDRSTKSHRRHKAASALRSAHRMHRCSPLRSRATSRRVDHRRSTPRRDPTRHSALDKVATHLESSHARRMTIKGRTTVVMIRMCRRTAGRAGRIRRADGVEDSTMIRMSEIAGSGRSKPGLPNGPSLVLQGESMLMNRLGGEDNGGAGL